MVKYLRAMLAIARYGRTIDFHPPPINFGDPLKTVILGLWVFYLLLQLLA